RASFASKQILQPKRDRVSGHAGASPRLLSALEVIANEGDCGRLPWRENFGRPHALVLLVVVHNHPPDEPTAQASAGAATFPMR
ncbi:hypothetical protein, partial [Burkholderia ubonensis]|uniref:hypothetical protein n=1 Tax=Burkholderia ubonensis TaxID=101571 RepID=UPI001E4FA493